MRNSRTTSAGSRCWPSTASFIARISSAVILPASAWRAVANLRPAPKSVITHKRDGLVGREVMAIVLERNEAQGLDRPIGRVGCNHVDLVRVERAVEQAEIHGARRPIEMQIVCGCSVRAGRRGAARIRIQRQGATAAHTALPGSASSDCCRRASSPRITMANVFSNPSGSATVTS